MADFANKTRKLRNGFANFGVSQRIIFNLLALRSTSHRHSYILYATYQSHFFKCVPRPSSVCRLRFNAKLKIPCGPQRRSIATPTRSSHPQIDQRGRRARMEEPFHLHRHPKCRYLILIHVPPNFKY